MSLTNSKGSCVPSFRRASATAPNQPGTEKVLGKCLLKKKGQAAWLSLWILFLLFISKIRRKPNTPVGCVRGGWGGVSSKSLYQTVVFHLTVEINSHDMQEREWTCLHGPRLGKPASSDGAIHKIPILLGNQVEGDYVASVTSQHGSVAFSGGHVTSFKVLFAELLGLFISLT